MLIVLLGRLVSWDNGKRPTQVTAREKRVEEGLGRDEDTGHQTISQELC